MAAIEDSRSNELAAEGDKANIDLVSVLNALTFASMFLDQHKVESGAFKRMLSDLVAISEGANPSAMLRPRPTSHRRPIAAPIEAVKGRQAAMVEYFQGKGLTRKEAATRVVRASSDSMKRKLGLSSPNTIESWAVQWGGDRGAEKGDGREGYEFMRAILQAKNPTEGDLRGTLKVLDDSLPG